MLKDAFDNDRASLLNSAFEALNEDEKYDAVLTGLCAKLIDGEMSSDPDQIAMEATLTPSQLALEKLKDPIQLMEEMNQRRIKASGRSLMALIDVSDFFNFNWSLVAILFLTIAFLSFYQAAGTTQDPRAMATILSLSLKNGSLSFYGSQQSGTTPLPPSPTSRVPQQNMTREQRLQSLPDVPTDNRAAEVSAAITTLGVGGSCLVVQGVGNGIGLDDITPYTNLLLSGMIGVGILDNFFDVIKGTGSMVVKMNSEKLPDVIKNAKGVEKENMPLGLGTGALTGNVVRGLTRLWSVDTERDCQCEAASFFAAYSLGLPCFSFRPNALEAANLVFESSKKGDGDDKAGDKSIDSLLSDTGIMKMLIWLMAPVAMESSLHPQLIASDPREARGFLQRLREKAAVFDAQDEIASILRMEDGDDDETSQEIEDLLKWAYTEADLLLRQNRAVVTELSENLIGGAATIGDCAALVEEW